jgi:hypothetical protein
MSYRESTTGALRHTMGLVFAMRVFPLFNGIPDFLTS